MLSEGFPLQQFNLKQSFEHVLNVYIDYITFNYKLCNISPALLNNRLAITISGPIRSITVGPEPKCYFLSVLLSCILVGCHFA